MPIDVRTACSGTKKQLRSLSRGLASFFGQIDKTVEDTFSMELHGDDPIDLQHLLQSQARTMVILGALQRTGACNPPDAISMLLANLRHVCDVEGLDFAKLDREAHINYTVERHGANESALN